MTVKFTAAPTTYLAADLTSSGTKLKLRSIDSWQSDTDLTSSDFGDAIYAVLLDKEKTKMEIIELDPTTLSSYGDVGITINTRGLPYVVDGDSGDVTEVSALKQNWSTGDLCLLGSDPSQVYRMMARLWNGGEVPGDLTLSGNNTFSGSNTFTGQVTLDAANYPTLDDGSVAPVNDGDLATKKYVADTAAGSGVSYNRIVIDGNAGEAISAGDFIYYDETDDEWKLTDANDTSKCNNVKIGIAQGSGTDGSAITGGVLILGMDSNQTGLSVGDKYYLSDTPGGITNTGGAGTTEEVEVGIAYSATEIVVVPRFASIPTADEKDALAGSGTPNATNKYVTMDSTAATNTDYKTPIQQPGQRVVWLDADATAGDLAYYSGATDDWKPLAAGTSGQILKQGASAPEWSDDGISMTAGEDITLSGSVPKQVFVEDGSGTIETQISQTVDNGYDDIYDVNQQYQSFTVTGFNYVDKVGIYGTKAGAFVDVVTVSLYAADGDDKPTGSELASDTKTDSQVIDGKNEFTLSYAVTEGSKYCIVVKAPYAEHATRFMWDTAYSDEYAGGLKGYSSDSGSSWTTYPSRDQTFTLTGRWVGTAGRIYETDSSITDKNKVHGYLTESVTSGNDGKVVFQGLVGNFTGLTPGFTNTITNGPTYLNISASERIITQDIN